MAKKREIEIVANNKEKYYTFKTMMDTYKAAMENGYYGEAELIVYAFMEDRLRAFLYYSNALDERNASVVNEDMKRILGIAPEDEKRVDQITNKITMIRKAFKICEKEEESTDEYVLFLRRVYGAAIDMKEMKSEFRKLEKWCKYRNEVVHGLFNKDIEDLRKGYEAHVKEGMKIGRALDTYVRKLKNA